MDEQDWYFKKGIESNLAKFAKLREDYNTYRDSFNSHTIDSLIEMKNKANEGLPKVQVMNGYFMRSVAMTHLKRQINYADELLLLKSGIDQLKDIEFYLVNSDES